MKLLRKVSQLFTGLASNKQLPPKIPTERELIELESEIGRTLFGAVPAKHRREFFCLDANTWVWYEEWLDDNKKKQTRTTRYEVHGSGILKVRDGGHYQYLEGEELRNFGLSTRVYFERVMRSVYKRDPYTGQPLTASTAILS